MPVDYTTYSRQRLDVTLTRLMDAADAMEQENPGQDQALKTDLTNRKSQNTRNLNLIDKEIMRREKEAAEKEAALRAEHDEKMLLAAEKKAPSVSAVGTGGVGVGGGGGGNGGGGNRDRLTLRSKAIDRALATLERFEPGVEVTTFTRNVRNLERLADCDLTKQYMVEGLSMKLCPEYLTAFNKYYKTTEVKTVEEFAAYLDKTYESKKSVFQYFAELDEFKPRSGESIQDFAARMKQDMFDLYTGIHSKWLDLKKKENSGFDGDLEAIDVFSLLEGLVLLRELKKDRECFNYVITRADECLDGGDLANLAASFIQRADVNDPVLGNSAQANVARHNNSQSSPKFDRSKLPCFSEQRHGVCKRDKCDYMHTVAKDGANSGDDDRWSYSQTRDNEEVDTYETKLARVKGLGLTIEHENGEYVRRTVELVDKYAELFGPETEPFPYEVSIPTAGDAVAKNQHNIPAKHKPFVDGEIEKMLQAGVIEPCSDPKGWRTPILTVDKPDGSIRVCLNFKNTLNTRLKDEEVYQQCPADELFSRIKPGNVVFAALDLKKGYWQLPLNPDCRHVTAFQWKNKTYQCTRLPFGLKTAGAIFCRAIAGAMNEAQFDEENTYCYLDDISVMAPDFETYLAALEKVFLGLSKFNLRLSPGKCKLLVSSIKFLGRQISKDRIEPAKENVQGVQAMVAPTSKRELQSLIGTLVWLRTFIGTRMGRRVGLESFSHHMAAIHKCNREKKFKWTDEAEHALEKIKKKLSEAPFLSLFDPDLPMVLTTDASDYAAGAVLMQRAAHDDYRVIGVVSKSFSDTEKRWSTTEKEAYAIRWAVEKFRYYLASTHFTIMSDHRSLLYIDRTTFKNQKISRWQDYLASYSFTLQFVEGVDNCFADWLSRGCAREKEERREEISKPAGRFMKIILIGENGERIDTLLRMYIPSWVTMGAESAGDCKFELETIDEGATVNFAFAFTFDENDQDKRIMATCAFVARRQCPDRYELFSHLNILEKQQEDPFYAKIANVLEMGAKNDKERVNAIKEAVKGTDHRSKWFSRHADDLFLDIGSGLLCRNGTKNIQIVVPDVLIPNYLHSAHDNLAHAGVDRVANYLALFTWPGKNNDIQHYVKSCESCPRVKGTYGQRKVKTGVNEKGSYPFETIFIDFVSMPSSHGYKYVLTVICSFCRFLVAYPLRSNSATDTCLSLIDFIGRFRRLPAVISSDRGTHFTGQILKQLLSGLDIKQKLHVAWRPQSSGVLERQHRTLKSALFMATKERGSPWHQCLQTTVSAMNASFNTATGCAPFEVVYGHKGLIGLPDLKTLKAENAADYSILANATLREIHENVTIANEATDAAYLEKANKGQLRRALVNGDHVCLYRPLSTDATKKEPWVGEFVVIETDEFVSKIRCVSTNKSEWVSNHHLRRLDKRNDRLCIDKKWDDENEPDLVLPVSSVPDESREACGVKCDSPTSTVCPDAREIGKSSAPVEKVSTSAAEKPRRSRRRPKKAERMNIASTKSKAYCAMDPNPRPSYRSVLIMGL